MKHATTIKSVSEQSQTVTKAREKNVPHVPLINNFFFFQRVRSNPAYVLKTYESKLSFLSSFNDLALKTKKLLISGTLLTFFNELHLKIPVLTVFLALRAIHFGPHNYIHGWKAVFDEQILVPRFGGF